MVPAKKVADFEPKVRKSNCSAQKATDGEAFRPTKPGCAASGVIVTCEKCRISNCYHSASEAPSFR